MKLFIDSDQASEIRELGDRGRVVGVTIPGDAPASLREICERIAGPVIVGVGAGDTAAMFEAARALSQLAANVVVRFPMSVDGIEAVRACAAARIAASVGRCTTAVQAVMAARAGAGYVEAPLGPASGNVADERDLVRKMIANLKMYGLPTLVVVGPLRTADQIVDAALAGAHAAAAPYAVLNQLGAPVPAAEPASPGPVSE